MPIHNRLQKPSNDAAVLALGLSNVSRVAKGQATSNSGSWFFPDGSTNEDGSPSGSGVIVGPDAGEMGGIAHKDPNGVLTPVFDTSELDKKLEQAQKDIDSLGDTITEVNNTLADNTEALEKAQQNVSDALEAAKNAEETADGKNKSFTQKDEPSREGLVQGDQWNVLDDDGNIISNRIWNGSEFVSHKLILDLVAVASSVGSTLIADGAIVTNKLASGSIDADKIAADAVTADAIASNSVDTDALKANSVTVAKLYITEEMMVKLLQAHKIQADEIDLNTLNGMVINGLQINGGQIQTATSGYRIRIKQDENDNGIIEFLNGNTVMTKIGFHNDTIIIGSGLDTEDEPGAGIMVDDSDKSVTVVSQGQLSLIGNNNDIYMYARNNVNVNCGAGGLIVSAANSMFNGAVYANEYKLGNLSLYKAGVWKGPSDNNGMFTIEHNLGRQPLAFIVQPYMFDGYDTQMKYFDTIVWSVNTTEAIIRLRRLDNPNWGDRQDYQCYWFAI